MREDEAAAQVQVFGLASQLEEWDGRLEAVYAGLPISPLEAVILAGEAEMDVLTELRSVIECIRNDRIRPAILALQAAAHFRPRTKVLK
jgi:hypothetical protein